MRTRPDPGLFLPLVGTVELLFLAALAWWPGPGVPVPGLFLFGGAVVAWGTAARVRSDPTDRTALRWVWVFALGFRLALLLVPPELSDDVYRYLWDGHVQLNGINPYLHPPADPILAGIRTPWHARINHPEIATIYPPLAQIAFLVVAFLGGTVLRMKVLWIGLDLLTAWILQRVARATDRDPLPVVLLYLWCPLLVVETAWSAHMEPLGLLGMAMLLLLVRTPGAAGVAGAMATLTKFAPAAALPPLARRLGLRFVAGFLVTVVVLYLPYADAGSALWEGLTTYARDWRFMTGPFALLETALPGRWPPRVAAAAGVIGVVAVATVRRFDPERALFWVVGTGLLLTPTLHPWYVLWILPFAALRRSVPWLLLCGLAFLGYAGLGTYQDTGSWPQPPWLRLILWTPPIALLLVQGFDLIRGGGGASTGPEPGEAEGQPAPSE